MNFLVMFLTNLFKEVFLDVLKTPAETTKVEETGIIERPNKPVNELLDQYSWLHDRS